MDVDDDDDFYAPDESVEPQPATDASPKTSNSANTAAPANARAADAELESGEEEEDEGAAAMDEDDDDSDSDSDIDIITERKDGSQPEPPAYAKPAIHQTLNLWQLCADRGSDGAPLVQTITIQRYQEYSPADGIQ